MNKEEGGGNIKNRTKYINIIYTNIIIKGTWAKIAQSV